MGWQRFLAGTLGTIRMKKRIEYLLTFLILVTSLNSCCIGAKEDYFGNNIYLSEYDNVDRKILYQTESCAYFRNRNSSNDCFWKLRIITNGLLRKHGNGRKRTEGKFFNYWVIKNDYESLPDSETVKRNTTEFVSRQDFDKFLTENKIELELNKIE